MERSYKKAKPGAALPNARTTKVRRNQEAEQDLLRTVIPNKTKVGNKKANQGSLKTAIPETTKVRNSKETGFSRTASLDPEKTGKQLVKHPSILENLLFQDLTYRVNLFQELERNTQAEQVSGKLKALQTIDPYNVYIPYDLCFFQINIILEAPCCLVNIPISLDQ